MYFCFTDKNLFNEFNYSNACVKSTEQFNIDYKAIREVSGRFETRIFRN